MIKFSTFSCILLLFITIGCAPQNRLSTYQTEMDSLRRELNFLKEQNSQLRREIDELKNPISDQELLIRQNKADLAAQITEMSQQLEAVQNQLRDTNDRISALMERSRNFSEYVPPTADMLSASDTVISNPSASTQPYAVDNSRELYNTAHRDVLRGNFQLALGGFHQFMQQYPNSELADNAQYWLGEVYYAQGRFSNAIDEFEKVIKWYKNGDKVPAALLKIGYSYISIDEIEQGKLYLEEVIQEYPDSQEANLAKGRLASLK